MRREEGLWTQQHASPTKLQIVNLNVVRESAGRGREGEERVNTVGQ